MAENEAKARKKLEEAEKKAKGGGGFFGGLFGSGKADEAADLFVQAEEDWSSSSESVLVCEESGCRMSFSSIASFEDHYQHSHRNQCAVCGLQFPNVYCLELHSDETHCSIFKTKRERDASAALFHCYEPTCSKSYASSDARNSHSEMEHGIRLSTLCFNGRRKLPTRRKAPSLDADLSNLSISSSRAAPKLLARVPRAPAGNLFKISKLWKEAGDAFVRSAEIHVAAADRKHDAASNYAEAANCYRKVNPQEAADFYKGEESRSSATKCLIKVGQYAAQLEDYKRAIKIFEEVAIWESDHPTLKYAAKNHFFQSLLCYLCLDWLDAQHVLKRYEEISPSFADSRESKFTETVKTFDKISRLDQWHTALLVKIKRSCGEEDDDDLK
ncbi:unnamed protein product [Gongylonema pulchrum]|uniref:C2H2-type domain-containing protein n=1 Tax=Gongylonema pulchrum TaxID=637853 RepID=A0A183EEH5_9BILA|nr:unnamed protein product [Gongylonema pulchrum]